MSDKILIEALRKAIVWGQGISLKVPAAGIRNDINWTYLDEATKVYEAYSQSPPKELATESPELRELREELKRCHHGFGLLRMLSDRHDIKDGSVANLPNINKIATEMETSLKISQSPPSASVETAPSGREQTLIEALESIRDLVDTDNMVSETEDGEQEYWINHLEVCHIVEETLEKISQSPSKSDESSTSSVGEGKEEFRVTADMYIYWPIKLFEKWYEEYGGVQKDMEPSHYECAKWAWNQALLMVESVKLTTETSSPKDDKGKEF